MAAEIGGAMGCLLNTFEVICRSSLGRGGEARELGIAILDEAGLKELLDGRS